MIGSATASPNVNYDPRGDVLYIAVGAPRPSYCEEPEAGVLFRCAFVGGAFTGVTILTFKQRWGTGTLPGLRFPVPIDLCEVAGNLDLASRRIE